jgi:hypothetical protein
MNLPCAARHPSHGEGSPPFGTGIGGEGVIDERLGGFGGIGGIGRTGPVGVGGSRIRRRLLPEAGELQLVLSGPGTPGHGGQYFRITPTTTP